MEKLFILGDTFSQGEEAGYDQEELGTTTGCDKWIYGAGKGRACG